VYSHRKEAKLWKNLLPPLSGSNFSHVVATQTILILIQSAVRLSNIRHSKTYSFGSIIEKFQANFLSCQITK